MREDLPEVVDRRHLARGHDVVVDRAHGGRRGVVFDRWQRGTWRDLSTRAPRSLEARELEAVNGALRSPARRAPQAPARGRRPRPRRRAPRCLRRARSSGTAVASARALRSAVSTLLAASSARHRCTPVTPLRYTSGGSTRRRSASMVLSRCAASMAKRNVSITPPLPTPLVNATRQIERATLRNDGTTRCVHGVGELRRLR